MAGIYTRDNLASLYASNLEKALARRDAYEKERQERVKSNVDAIKNGLASIGRAVTYGTSGTAADKLAALQKEYEEALAEEARVMPALHSVTAGDMLQRWDLSRLRDLFANLSTELSNA